MDVCILNSGFGSRLKKYTKDRPKGLVPIGEDLTILGYQLEQLKHLGDFHYGITTGYLDGMIQKYVDTKFPSLQVSYFYNNHFDTTNYITSLQKIKGRFDNEIVLMHGDLVFELSVIEDVLRSEKSVVVIDSTLPLPPKDFKARIKQGKVVEIGIDLFGDDCFACQPLYHLIKRDWNTWQTAIDSFCKRGETSVYAENALNAITTQLDLYPLDVAGRLCMEVDDESDLERAQQAIGEK